MQLGWAVFTYTHGEHARAVREGALVLEQVQVHLADVMLQVEGGGEVGLAVAAGAHQHGFVRGVSALVSAQGVGPLELLLACLAREHGCREEGEGGGWGRASAVVEFRRVQQKESKPFISSPGWSIDDLARMTWQKFNSNTIFCCA